MPDFPGQGLLSAPGQPPNEFERAIARKVLENTLDFPKEFKGWVPRWVGSEPEVIPIGSLSGSIPLSKISGLPVGTTEGQLIFWDADTGAYALSDAPGTTGLIPTWDATGEQFEMSPPIQVVNDIADADAFNGAACRLRAGSSPYQFVDLSYDSTYGQWVSTPRCVLSFEIIEWDSVHTDPTDLGVGSFIGANMNAIADAGLVPQFMGGYWINTSLGGTDGHACDFMLYEVVHNESGYGTNISSAFFYGERIGSGGGAVQWKVFDWTTVTPSSTTDAAWRLAMRLKNTTAGSGGARNVNIYMRWVDA